MIATMKATLESDGVRSSLLSRKLKTRFKEDEKSFGSYLFLMLIILVALIIAMLWFIALIARQKDREEILRIRAKEAQIEQLVAFNRLVIRSIRLYTRAISFSVSFVKFIVEFYDYNMLADIYIFCVYMFIYISIHLLTTSE